MSDLYADLEVPRTASAADIKAAWKRHSRSLHPDRNPDPRAAARFQRVTAAYQVLGDPTKRALYDEFGDESLRVGFDAERSRAARADWLGGATDPLREFFQTQERVRKAKVRPVEVDLPLEFIQALDGGSRRVVVSDEEVTVSWAPGVRTGDHVILPRRGKAPVKFIVRVAADRRWSIVPDTDDVAMRVEIHMYEAVGKEDIDIETPRGPITVRLSEVRGPVQHGMTLRLFGLGMEATGRAPGSLVLTFDVIPPTKDAVLLRELQRCSPPRALAGRH